MSSTVLVVLHQEHSTPGRVGRLLRERGFRLDIRRPPLGDTLPMRLDDHAGAIVFGGPMSANDPHDWVRAEIDFIGRVLKAEKPFLGICLGAQMLAKQVGGRVERHPDGHVEIGYHDIRPTAAGEALVHGTPWPDSVYHWHSEGIEAPCCSEILAEGDVFPHQAFRVDTGYGLQFHPEVTYAMMCRWTVKGCEHLGAAPGARDRREQLEGWFLHDRHVREWLDTFLDRWIGEPIEQDPTCGCAMNRPGTGTVSGS
jgi:GMP synthase (glutamine-hydrolysing)